MPVPGSCVVANPFVHALADQSACGAFPSLCCCAMRTPEPYCGRCCCRCCNMPQVCEMGQQTHSWMEFFFYIFLNIKKNLNKKKNAKYNTKLPKRGIYFLNKFKSNIHPNYQQQLTNQPIQLISILLLVLYFKLSR